jgi:hypothetical protein
MKIIGLLFYFVILISWDSFSQIDNQFTKDISSSSPETSQRSGVVRNVNAINVNIDGVVIDKRVARYYSAGDLEQKTKSDAIKINHIYLDSYELINKNNLSDLCLDNIKSNFDLANVNHLRKKSERVLVPISFDGCIFNISLFSWDEVNSLD